MINVDQTFFAFLILVKVIKTSDLSKSGHKSKVPIGQVIETCNQTIELHFDLARVIVAIHGDNFVVGLSHRLIELLQLIYFASYLL